MSALSKFHSTRLSIQELLSGRIRLQRYGLFLKIKHLYSVTAQHPYRKLLVNKA